jgi:hypothetical protein
MSEIANARLNTFGTALPKADFEPSSEQIFVFTVSHIQQIIQAATVPLIEKIEILEAKVTSQDEKIAALEATQDTQADNQLIQLRLINDIRESTKKEPQPLQKDRANVLRAILAANNGKMLSKEVRKLMHLSKDRFSKLLAICDFIETKPYYLDRRQEIIILKSELVARN